MILVSVFVIITFFRTVINSKWRLIYTAFGNDQYFTVIAKLQSAGIKYKVVMPFSGMDTRNIRVLDNTQYDIYVKKEDEHKAITKINS